MGKQVSFFHEVEQYKGLHVLEIKEYSSFGARQSDILFMLIKTIRRKYRYEAIPFIRRISGGKERFIAFPIVILSKIGLLPKGKKNLVIDCRNWTSHLVVLKLSVHVKLGKKCFQAKSYEIDNKILSFSYMLVFKTDL